MKDLLTSDDYNFGLTITKEYPKIPLNDLYVLIYDVRRQIEYAAAESIELNKMRQTDISEFKEKLSSGTVIKNIVVNTNKGPLTIYNYGGIYDNLFITANKLLPKYLSEYKNDDKLIKYLSIDYPFNLIVATIKKTSLGPDQKRAVIGMLVVYFRLFPWMTEDQHKVSPILGTYKRHLIDKVKSKKI